MTGAILISNPSSGSSDEGVLREVIERLRPLGEVRSVQPSGLDTFDDEVRTALGDGNTVVVAGGDGTFNCAVNAFADRFEELRFGLVPMGTGNDLARTLGLPQEPAPAALAVGRGEVRTIDVARATSSRVERLFVNASVGGFPVAVNQAIDEDTKKRFGPLAFWVGGLKAARGLIRYTVEVGDMRIDDVLAAGVGNGRTAGGGIELWPGADPDDGQLDCCVLSAPDLSGALEVAARLARGSHERLDGVTTLRAPSLTISSSPHLEFNCDGDLIGLETPVTFEVIGSLTMLGESH